MHLVAQLVKHPLLKRTKFGLTVDRLSSPRIIAANGKNFITVNVERLGGPGAAIVRLPI